MNVFVLSTGRCATNTFAQACKHIDNYTSAHESRRDKINKRLSYPDNHIEIDNHISWMLGRLDKKYGDRAVYVHLKRNLEDNARSWVKKENKHKRKGRIWFYSRRIIYTNKKLDQFEVAKHYCETTNMNIELFLRDKTNYMEFEIDTAKQDFKKFWELINARGDLQGALGEWDKNYNSIEKNGLFKKVYNKIKIK